MRIIYLQFSALVYYYGFRKKCAGIVRDCFLGINTQQHDCARPQTCSYQKFLFYDTIQSLSGFSHGAFQCLLLFTKKFFAPIISHQPLALRNPHCKNKTKQIVACSAQEKYLLRFVKRFSFRHSQNDVQNTKAFSQQTIHAQIKRSTVWIRAHSFLRKTWQRQRCNAPSDLYFSSFSQNHNRSIKNCRNQQSYQSTSKSVRKYNNNKQSFNQVLPKTTILSISHENNHDNQSPHSPNKNTPKTNKTYNQIIHQDFWILK